MQILYAVTLRYFEYCTDCTWSYFANKLDRILWGSGPWIVLYNIPYHSEGGIPELRVGEVCSCQTARRGCLQGTKKHGSAQCICLWTMFALAVQPPGFLAEGLLRETPPTEGMTSCTSTHVSAMFNDPFNTRLSRLACQRATSVANFA